MLSSVSLTSKPYPKITKYINQCSLSCGGSVFWEGIASEGLAAVVTRSQRGHMLRLEAEVTVGGPTFMALSSSTSLWSLWFCSVSEPNHLLKYSHSISVCFSLLLNQNKSKTAQYELIILSM